MQPWCVHRDLSIVLGHGGTPKVTEYNYLTDTWKQLFNIPAKWWCQCSWRNRFRLLIILPEHSMLSCPHNFHSWFRSSKTKSIFSVTDFIIFKNNAMFSWVFLISIPTSFFLLNIVSSPFALRIQEREEIVRSQTHPALNPASSTYWLYVFQFRFLHSSHVDNDTEFKGEL